MATMKDINDVFPNAYAVGGKVIVYHDVKHRELGDYFGEDFVKLTIEGQALLDAESIKVAASVAQKLGAKRPKTVSSGNFDL